MAWEAAAGFGCVGVASWLAANTLFTHLPALEENAPEGPGLAASLNVSLQLANIAPALYVLWQQGAFSAPNWCRKRPTDAQGDENEGQSGSVGSAARWRDVWGHTVDAKVISVLLATGMGACALLAALWNQRTQSLSLALLILSFFAGIADATSSVTFWPHAAQWAASRKAPIHTVTTALSVGTSCSALIPAVLALCSPSPTLSFAVASLLALLALLAHLYLEQKPLAVESTEVGAEEGEEEGLLGGEGDVGGVGVWERAREHGVLLCGAGMLSFWQNGVSYSILPFAMLGLPQGAEWYKWASATGAMADPVGALLATWVPQTIPRCSLWALLHLSATLLLAIPLLVSCGSPHLFSNTPAIPLLAYVATRAATSHLRTSVFVVAAQGSGWHQSTTNQNPARDVILSRIVAWTTQAAACAGAILILALAATNQL